MNPLVLIVGGIGALGATAAAFAVASQAVAGDGTPSGSRSERGIETGAEEVNALTLLEAVASGSEPGCAGSAVEVIELMNRYHDDRRAGKRGNKWLRRMGRAADRLSSCVSGTDLRRFGFRDALQFIARVVDAAVDGYVVSKGGSVTRDETVRGSAR